MAGIYQNSINNVLYSTPRPIRKPQHVTEAKSVCRNIGRLLERFEKKNCGESFEVTMDQTEEQLESELELMQNKQAEEKSENGTDEVDGINRTETQKVSPSGFHFANSFGQDTVIHKNTEPPTPIHEYAEKFCTKANCFLKTCQEAPDTSLVETPILRTLSRQNSGYEQFKSRCDTDSAKTSTPTTPRRILSKPVSGRRLFDSSDEKDIKPKLITQSEPRALKLPTQNEFMPLVETPILRASYPRQTSGYRLFKDICEEDAATTSLLFKFLDNDASGVSASMPNSPCVKKTIKSVSASKPSTPSAKQVTTPLRPKPASAKVVSKPRPSSTYSNSSEESDASSGNDFPNKTARKEVLAASAEFSQWESEQLRVCAVGSAQCRLNILKETQRTERSDDVEAVMEIYRQCSQSSVRIPALDTLCLALVSLNNNVADQELTEHEKYAAFKYAKKLQQNQA